MESQIHLSICVAVFKDSGHFLTNTSTDIISLTQIHDEKDHNRDKSRLNVNNLIAYTLTRYYFEITPGKYYFKTYDNDSKNAATCTKFVKF